MMYFAYAWTTLWGDRQRYFPGVLAVAFSASLMALQSGMLLGMFTFASLTIDRAQAHIWLGGPRISTVDMAYPIFERDVTRLASQPEVEQAEVYLQKHDLWVRPDGSIELCLVVGARLDEQSLGAVRELTPDLRLSLQENGAVVVDESDLKRLGIHGVGDVAEISGHRARVVGLTHGFRSPAGAHVFCSMETARQLTDFRPNQISYALGRCRDPEDAPAVVERLRASYPGLSAFTAPELSLRSRVYWLTKTKGGEALGYVALVGLLVGALVTAQTLYAATVAQLRQYAVLWALGTPIRRMAALVLAQAFCVGIAGLALAFPVTFALAWAAELLSVVILLPGWLLAATAAVTMAMALGSGFAAMRSLRRIEPAVLLR
jgi:putative ABC transport system permease protein